MGLFSKEKKGDEVKTDLSSLPELPNSNNLEFPTQPTLPTTNSQEMQGLPPIETSNLPSLPELNQTQPADQQEIKKALTSPPSIPLQELQKSQFNGLKTEIKKENLHTQPIEYEKSESTKPGIYHPTQKPQTNEPIFIRLDKFQNAVETFEEIIDKVNDIENLIKKTKEIRAKEEEELNAWEKEINTIKTRMDSIDKSVFNKLDLI